MVVDSNSKFKDLDKCMYPDLALEAVRLGLVAGTKKEDGIYLDPSVPITREQSWLIDLRQQKLMGQVHNIPKLVERYMPSIARVWTPTGVGSGSYIARNLILTNAHVVKTAEEVTVDTMFKKGIKARVVKVGDEHEHGKDLAIIRIDFVCPHLKLASEIVQGEPCLVMGNPAGEWQAVSAGIVMRYGGEYLQTDGLVNPGNSGGAVINFRGQLLAVPTWKFVADGFDNHNYCISVDCVKDFIKDVIKS